MIISNFVWFSDRAVSMKVAMKSESGMPIRPMLTIPDGPLGCRLMSGGKQADSIMPVIAPIKTQWYKMALMALIVEIARRLNQGDLRRQQF